jgi:hypothetical protein
MLVAINGAHVASSYNNASLMDKAILQHLSANPFDILRGTGPSSSVKTGWLVLLLRIFLCKGFLSYQRQAAFFMLMCN